MSDEANTLVEIRDILSRMHDSRAGRRDPGLSQIEMAALRDSCRRLTEVIVEINRRAAATKERT